MNEGQWSWMRSVVVELSGELKSVVVRSGGCNSCLLYTSDAADDMQCVDLGGRRIIKKSRGR